MNNLYLKLGRFDRPIGITLLTFPCWWGVATITKINLPISLLLLFVIGAAVMRAAGCVVNDIYDREIDSKVSRTKNRPLAAGDLSVKQAIIFAGALLMAGALVLVQLPSRCWLLAALALVLLLTYPLVKRFSHWPQAVLGLAFNSGIFIGAAALAPFAELPWITLSLEVLAGILITIAYDTIYACQDRDEDRELGLGSTALRFGAHVKQVVALCYFSAAVLLIIAMAGSHFTLIGIAIIILSHSWFIYKTLSLSLEDKPGLQQFFVNNQRLLALIFLAITLN